MPGIVVLNALTCAPCSGYRLERAPQARSGTYCITSDTRAGPTGHESDPPAVALRQATVRLQKYASVGQIRGSEPLVARKQLVGHCDPTDE